MDGEPRYLVTLTFRSGAQARIRMSQRPAIPVTYHVPGTLFWIGDDDGPKVEVAGGELIDLDISDAESNSERPDHIDPWPDTTEPDARGHEAQNGEMG